MVRWATHREEAAMLEADCRVEKSNVEGRDYGIFVRKRLFFCTCVSCQGRRRLRGLGLRRAVQRRRWEKGLKVQLQKLMPSSVKDEAI